MQNSDRYSIGLLCQCLGVSRSGFYKYFSCHSDRRKRKEIICASILKSWNDSHHIYGSPRIAEDLHEEGYNVSQSTVAKYMKELGISSCSLYKRKRGKSTSLSIERNPYIQNRIKGLMPTSINQIWTTDITYIRTQKGFAYLSTIVDMFSKRPVAMCISKRQDTALIIKTMRMALERRGKPKGVILHSDKGSQYRSLSFRKLLARFGIVQSFTSIGHSCDENTWQESFHATLKKELIRGRTYRDIEEAERDIFRYLEGFYSNKRRHSALGGLTPNQIEQTISSSI